MPLHTDAPLRTRDVINFWIPLSATWLMMAVEGPILTSLIARLPDPTYNLAAYGVAISLAMLIESPVIMLLSMSVALATDRHAVERLRAFTWRINALVTAGMLIVSIPAVYNVVAYGILNMPPEVAERMYAAFVCLIPWPAAIGYRRFYQGLLIRAGQTRLVAYGTVVRIISMAGSAFALAAAGAPGTLVGAISLSVGVTLEAVATRAMSFDVLRRYREQDEHELAPPPTYRDVMRFYVPLAMTSVIGFVVTPMLAFFMGRSPMSVESLAVLPVVDSFVFLFRSFGFSYQEVGIALLGERRQHLQPLQRVGAGIAIATTVVLVIVAFTPAAAWLYQGMYGLSAQLAAFAIVPTMILVPLPALAVLYSLQRAVLISARRSVAVTWSTIVEVGLIAAVMAVLVGTINPVGVISAAVAMVVGRIVANAYLARQTRQVLRQPA
ncbi:MAG: hypothetical protein FGM24_01280 [Candidatus Kapabacteria bacterium]|nr:hypothetical protein [Candidatus Kapabacteria bacterium]